MTTLLDTRAPPLARPLASDEAAWVTGTNIVVDGGASAIM